LILDVETYKQDLIRCKQSLDELGRNYSILQQENITISNLNVELKQNNEDLDLNKKVLNNKNDKFNIDIIEKDRIIHDLQTINRQLNTSIENLNLDNTRLTDKLNTELSIITTNSSNIQNQMDEILILKNDCNNLRTIIDERELTIKRKENDYSELLRSNNLLKEENKDKTEKLIILNDANESLQKTNLNLNQILNEHLGKLEHVVGQLETKELEINSLKKELKEKSTETNQLNGDMILLQLDLDNLKDNNSSLQNEISNMKNGLSSKDSSMNQLLEKNIQSQIEKDNIIDTLKFQLSNVQDTMKNEFEIIRDDNEKLKIIILEFKEREIKKMTHKLKILRYKLQKKMNSFNH